MRMSQGLIPILQGCPERPVTNITCNTHGGLKMRIKPCDNCGCTEGYLFKVHSLGICRSRGEYHCKNCDRIVSPRKD